MPRIWKFRRKKRRNYEKKLTRLEKAYDEYLYTLQDLLCNPINEDLPNEYIDPLCDECDNKFLNELYKDKQETIEFLNEGYVLMELYSVILKHFKSEDIYNAIKNNIINRKGINPESAKELLTEIDEIIGKANT